MTIITEELNGRPLGRIIKVYEEKDNASRVAKIKTATGYMVQPYQRLYLKEMPGKAKDRVEEHEKRNERKGKDESKRQ